MNKYKIFYYGVNESISSKEIEADRFEISGGGVVFYKGEHPSHAFSSYVSVEKI